VLVAGMAAATLATLSAVAARWSGPADAPCTAGQERLAEAWGDSQREAIEQAFARVDAEFAATSRQTVQQELDGYAAAWLEGYRDACEATHVRHEQSTELLDRRMACLEQRRSALRATAELLAQADRDAIAHSIRAATSLPPVGECARTDRLTAGFAAPPDPDDAERAEHLRAQLAHAHALGTTGQAQAGLAEALGVQEQARALGYAPLRAEAALAVGILAYTGGRHEDSLPALHHAIDEAIAARHDEVLVSAATRLVSEIGVGLSRYDEAERWGRLALAAVERRGQDPDDAIDLHRTLCMMRADKGAPREALPDCERALELSIARFGPEHSTTGMAHRALGNAHYAAGDYAAAERDYQRATALFLASHGHDHPEYPALLNSLAAVCYSQRPGPACVDLFVQTLDVAVRSYGPEHPAVADFTNNLAIVLFEEGRIDEAETHARRSLELRRAAFGDGHPGVGAAHRVLAMVAQARHDDPSALDHANRAVSILRATRGAAHPDVLESLRVRADIHLDAQRIDEALLDLQEALRLVDQLERPASQRAEVRFSLARTLTDHRPGQAERARALAAEAEALAAGTPLAAQIAQWRAEPRDDAATSPPPSPSPGDRSPPPAPRPR
ncbi:MAG: tetratricopeptide repeat protein, partial [Myxococcales bacterium]|nr:tetratricopeptide repeat protein [Myxococcales bacterium]